MLAFYAPYGGYHFDICKMNADGSGRVKVTDDPTLDQDPVWSPDGTQIAFSRYLAVNTNDVEIHLVNVDGSGLVQVTSGMRARFPTWSPDGARIAFQGYDGTDYRIWSVKPDGTGLTPLTPPSVAGHAPGWSPDGTKIAYSGDGIWTMNADGTSPVQVAPGTRGAWGPDWQPVLA
jgi:TolB protein